MFAFHKISVPAAAVVTAGAALVLVSAPAASSPHSGRLLVTSASARGRPPHVLDTSGNLFASRAAAHSQATVGLGRAAQVSARGEALGITSVASRGAPGDEVRVVVESQDPAVASARVRALGGHVERSARGLVQALVPTEAASALAARPGVDRVRAPYSHIETAVNGEEVSATLAAAWHAKGFTGKSVKVAIIDGGFQGLSERQVAGELPSDLITQDDCGGQFATATDHGTAVAEIVHEMAPDASLYLVCVDTEVDLAAAEAYAKSQGVSVINHSMGWEGAYREDGTSPVDAIVADARASGILWVNAAGNEAQNHWSGSFASKNGIHLWNANGDEGNSFVWLDGEEICGILKWDEWPAAVSDFDLGLFLSGPNVPLVVSAEDQSGGQPPVEGLCARQSSGVDLHVFWAIGGFSVRSTPRLDLVSWSPPLEYYVAAGSIATPAESPAALAVGALCWQSRQLEPYSSQGPTIDGRVKPDIVGHDSVSSATYGSFFFCPSAFAGTSASAPEVAGAAALLKQVYPRSTPDQLETLLTSSARDLGAAGADNVYGAGEIQLPAPPDVTAPKASALGSKGLHGRTLKILSRVSDDSGQVSVVEQITLGGKTIATIDRGGFRRAASPTVVATPWNAPVRPGTYRHCVRATDRAGNSSTTSCATVVVG
jgi:subtilisin family serine protease